MVGIVLEKVAPVVTLDQEHSPLFIVESMDHGMDHPSNRYPGVRAQQQRNMSPYEAVGTFCYIQYNNNEIIIILHRRLLCTPVHNHHHPPTPHTSSTNPCNNNNHNQ